MPKQIANNEYIVNGGRTLLGIVKPSMLKSGGDAIAYDATKQEYLIIVGVASRNSKFPDGTKPLDIIQLHKEGGFKNAQNLTNGDSCYRVEVKDNDPLTTASISQTAETVEITTQRDEGQAKQIPTGKLTTEITLTMFPTKGNTITQSVQTSSLREIGVAQNGTFVFTNHAETEMLIIVFDLYGQSDFDEGIACVVRPSAKTFTYSVSETTPIEIPCQLSSKANLTKIKETK